jgi:phosphoribosyl-ATP pyrophosphohydrolase
MPAKTPARKVRSAPSVKTSDAAVLDRLYTVIHGRRGADPDKSYVARLFAKGRLKIAQKVGEEGVETALAAAAGTRHELVGESADLLFMLLVLWSECGVKPADVFAELARREGHSGIDEKKSRADVKVPARTKAPARSKSRAKR